ncbi:MAG: hypothetical protein CSA55_01795 [Ilumatobacter coccineus]|uniref:AB hydrolase-1 domain-containing protein n=1 Tax=Ilumatobacter coccineus TaxID=467094 RepID=A0A2G6KEG6_9ACTN|nr:MAG: hypothetical protein CSA55_01795 [Ilumatobacter coccineus]
MVTPEFDRTFTSSGLVLEAYLRHPVPDDTGRPSAGVILCHGFPVAPLDAQRAAASFPQLVDRIVDDTGYTAMTFSFRGCGASQGEFSLQGWVDDLRAAIDHFVETTGIDHVALIGTMSGGATALCLAAEDARVAAVAMLASPAGFGEWADHWRRFLDHARDMGAVHSPEFPPSLDEWKKELRRFEPLVAAHQYGHRPLLIIHGAEDRNVDPSDARSIARAHGSAEFRLLSGAGNRLRHDPRAISILLGWLERIRDADDSYRPTP